MCRATIIICLTLFIRKMQYISNILILVAFESISNKNKLIIFDTNAKNLYLNIYVRKGFIELKKEFIEDTLIKRV